MLFLWCLMSKVTILHTVSPPPPLWFFLAKCLVGWWNVIVYPQFDRPTLDDSMLLHIYDLQLVYGGVALLGATNVITSLTVISNIRFFINCFMILGVFSIVFYGKSSWPRKKYLYMANHVSNCDGILNYSVANQSKLPKWCPASVA